MIYKVKTVAFSNCIFQHLPRHTNEFYSVRQARTLLWDALWVVLANKHGEKFILEKEKYFQSELLARITNTENNSLIRYLP